MMDIKERKKILFDVIQLEKERDEFKEEIFVKEKEMKKLNSDLEYAQEEYNKLENSGIQKFFLGITGKREARLQEAQNEIRRIRSEIASVDFAITSARNRMDNIADELEETADYVKECISFLAETEDGDKIKSLITVAREIPVICNEISEKMIELKPLLTKAEEIYTYGDINADLSGRRYNRKDSTLRELTWEIAPVVKKLISRIDEYNLIVPEGLRIEFREKWMDEEDYWKGQQLAEDSYDRIKKVDDWFFRFTNLWKKMKKQQDEVLEQMRNEVLDYLV